MSKIICVPHNAKLKSSQISIDVTSWANSPFSPFTLKTDKGIVENVWQFSKVYGSQIDLNDEIKPEWFKWRDKGYKSKIPIRYPMGKEAKSIFSYWNDKRLTKVEARKEIYIPLYTESVLKTQRSEFYKLIEYYKELSKQDKDLYILDFDGYNRHKLNMSLEDVINHKGRSMGHSFVLEMMILDKLGIKYSSVNNKFF